MTRAKPFSTAQRPRPRTAVAGVGGALMGAHRAAVRDEADTEAPLPPGYPRPGQGGTMGKGHDRKEH
jgi:hypothetical protein